MKLKLLAKKMLNQTRKLNHALKIVQQNAYLEKILGLNRKKMNTKKKNLYLQQVAHVGRKERDLTSQYGLEDGEMNSRTSIL